MIWKKDDAPVRAPFCSDALPSGGWVGGRGGGREGGERGGVVVGGLEQASLAESRGYPRGVRHSYSDSPVVQAAAGSCSSIPILGTGAHPGPSL
jgi:hypothetical protein